MNLYESIKSNLKESQESTYLIVYYRGNPQLANGGYYTTTTRTVENKRELNACIKRIENPSYGTASVKKTIKLDNPNAKVDIDRDTGKLTIDGKSID